MASKGQRRRLVWRVVTARGLRRLAGRGAGEEDRPADLCAVLALVVGVGEADQEVLADRAVDADGAFGHGGAQGAVGAVDVVGRALVDDDRYLDGGDLEQ